MVIREIANSNMLGMPHRDNWEAAIRCLLDYWEAPWLLSDVDLDKEYRLHKRADILVDELVTAAGLREEWCDA
jgi:hypothetical protein